MSAGVKTPVFGRGERCGRPTKVARINADRSRDVPENKKPGKTGAWQTGELERRGRCPTSSPAGNHFSRSIGFFRNCPVATVPGSPRELGGHAAMANLLTVFRPARLDV